MNPELKRIEKEVYEKCSFKITDFIVETESKEYGACQFQLNNMTIICRNAKKTPKKNGQFVTFWKRTKDKSIGPYEESDTIDFFIINVRDGNQFGQFVFPKSEMIRRSIISTDIKEGKRGFRVYPPWDIVNSKQAEQTQKWQTQFFYRVGNSTDIKLAKSLYQRFYS